MSFRADQKMLRPHDNNSCKAVTSMMQKTKRPMGTMKRIYNSLQTSAMATTWGSRIGLKGKEKTQ